MSVAEKGAKVIGGLMTIDVPINVVRKAKRSAMLSVTALQEAVEKFRTETDTFEAQGDTNDERWDDARAYYGTTTEDIARFVSQGHQGFWILATFEAAIAGITVVKGAGWGLYSFLAAGVLFVTVLALMIQRAHGNWQLRHRRLDSLMDYFKDGDWLPKSKAAWAEAELAQQRK